MEQDTAQNINPELHKPSPLDALHAVQDSIEGIQNLPKDEQLETIEGLAMDVLQEDEEGKANIAAIQEARRTGDEETAQHIVAEQKQIFQRIKKEIAFMCNVELEDSETEKQEYRQRLFEKVSELKDQEDDEKIMERVGFIQTDPETGEKHFTFPEDIFPPYIREKWESYARYVENHVRAAASHDLALQNNTDDIIRWDAIRRATHNGLTMAVQDFLQLEEWDLERCRKFITKMLEHRIPTVETRESKLTSQAVLRNFKELRTIGEYKP